MRVNSYEDHLYVNGLVIGGHASLLHSFRKRWVSVAGTSKIFRRSTILHPDDSLMDHFTGVRAEHVNAKKAIGLLASKHFHHAISIVYRPCAAVRHEGEHALIVFDARFFKFLLILAHRGELGMSVDDIGDSLIIHVTPEASHVLYSCDAFFLSFVSKHGSLDRIPNGVDMRKVCLEVIIGLDDSTIHLDADVFKTKTLEEGHTANRHQDFVCLKDLLITAFRRGDLQLHAVCCERGPKNLSPELKFH
mmetsp:Transcript_30093/g.58019  ORF Transcript_30093/g.58019 Transcript_30093/m.58019 type:complete len:248 (-) Transcript_30093:824-1567(-)